MISFARQTLRAGVLVVSLAFAAPAHGQCADTVIRPPDAADIFGFVMSADSEAAVFSSYLDADNGVDAGAAWTAV